MMQNIQLTLLLITALLSCEEYSHIDVEGAHANSKTSLKLVAQKIDMVAGDFHIFTSAEIGSSDPNLSSAEIIYTIKRLPINGFLLIRIKQKR